MSLPSGFYLAGGTGLALHFGHRRSVDFDFFAPEAFHEEALLASLERYSPSVLSRAPQTLHLLLDGIKVSFLGYPHPLLFSTDLFFSSVEVADARDIACMKLSAVASRGTRRDFVDLYVAAKTYSTSEILTLFARKYAGIEYNRLHLLKSLSYFDDAEADPPLEMLKEITWEDVKDFFARESAALL